MSENTNPQLLTDSRFSREQQERDRDAAMRSLDETTLRPAFRYASADDTTEWRYAAPSPSPTPVQQRAPRRRWKVGVGAICAIALAFGVVTAIVVHATSPRASSVGLLGVQQTESSGSVESVETNEPQVTATETEGSTEGTGWWEQVPQQEPETTTTEPETTEPGVSVVTEEPVEETSEPETYTLTWTDDSPDGRGRQEHSLTYTYDNGSYTIDYDGYSFTVTEEELEWLLGEGWDGGQGDGSGGAYDWGEGFGWDDPFGFEQGPGRGFGSGW